MYENLIKFFYDYFIDETKEWFMLLSSSVCIGLLSCLYKKFVYEGIGPLETLPEERKIKLWNQDMKYQTEKEKRIEAYMAAYTLELITSKD